jgi:hypothetical protein
LVTAATSVRTRTIVGAALVTNSGAATVSGAARGLPTREQSCDQSPSADRRSSTRGVASQVNSFSERPKCP